MPRNILFIVLACVALVLAAALVVQFVVPSRVENRSQPSVAKAGPA